MAELRNLALLNKKLNYRGGNQEGRFIKDKEHGLKQSLLYSYQAATAELADGREFRCLINPDKTKNDYDQKMLSIPFEDICLNKPRVGKTTKGLEPTNVQGGDVFRWVETDTYWLVYLRYLEEDAYYRYEIRRCKEVIEVNGHPYHVYVRGPVETTIQWLQKKGIDWNKLNYSLELYITKNQETLDFFHRFTKLKINGKNWEVKAIDWYGGDGIIQILLGETFNNEIEDKYYQIPEPTEMPIDTPLPHIEGLDLVKPFSKHTYTIVNLENPNGHWFLDNKRAKITKTTDNSVTIEIVTGKSGEVVLTYTRDGEDDIVFPIKISSLT